jgi:cytochrome c556
MSFITTHKSRTLLALTLSAVSLAVSAQNAPDPVKQAVEQRQAVFKLIALNFKPIGDVLQGRTPYDATEIKKRTARVAFLAELAGDAFPENSNAGLPTTKAKAEIWSNRADFDKRLNDLLSSTKNLAQVTAKETTASDAFKTAAGAVGQACKGCHDNFREK